MRWPTISLGRPPSLPKSDWVRYASNDDLETLLALFDAAGLTGPMNVDRAAPDPPDYVIEKYADVRAQAEAAMASGAVPVFSYGPSSSESVEINLPADKAELAAWIKERWTSTGHMARQTLRRVAESFGIDVPMERTKPPRRVDSEQGKTQGEPENAAEAAAKELLSVEPKDEPEAKRPNPALTDESVWEPCASLFDALHPENRGWWH